jgi:hypothetical protein
MALSPPPTLFRPVPIKPPEPIIVWLPPPPFFGPNIRPLMRPRGPNYLQPPAPPPTVAFRGPFASLRIPFFPQPRPYPPPPPYPPRTARPLPNLPVPQAARPLSILPVPQAVRPPWLSPFASLRLPVIPPPPPYPPRTARPLPILPIPQAVRLPPSYPPRDVARCRGGLRPREYFRLSELPSGILPASARAMDMIY